MKKEIHPVSRPTIFIDTSCGIEFVANSTIKTDEKREVDGVPYQVCRIEISSASHPFYTGKQLLIDTARRAEKFQEKIAKVKTVGAVRKGKKVKRVKAEAKKTAKRKAANETTESAQ